ncbi:hydroxymethylglutaryl-CoA lyase [Paeniglutamicibacter sulfureus]|uniref:Hydroxymethylglutaryl-CoA lyase n=1 Tax=Paeniglutamicibacter sulfureus TaxID=43666 RepID=A0ABU2BJ61_9MICC|nr:hydroxymethylglutaryl-CoA lyase [Paeniglutamicibacter sulfureus]MDR7358681.1 hydroxymethylglutaryl-CoA lyase [Paeniglutamicibacter sulfureus]
MQIHITDVFLRDGLQDENVIVSTGDKLAIAEALVASGVKRLEVASFVNPARVPQMGDADAVLTGLPTGTGATFTSLALNGKGIVRAVAAGATHIQVVTSASQTHSTANAGSSIEQALESLAADVAAHPGINFFAGISTAFTCPFEGEIDSGHLLRVVRAFKAMGITQIGLADTLGTTPTERLMQSVRHVQDAEPELTYYLHLHNAHGQALATIDAAIAAGITRFDSALGGYGGCPFAPGAAGNLATEELVAHLHAAGHETGIDEAGLYRAVRLGRDAVSNSPALPVNALTGH